MPHRLYSFVAARADNRCEYWLAPAMIFNFTFDVEHIRPRRAGGSDDVSNLALACRACNSAKFTAMSARDPIGGQIVRLYNPRLDVWDQHFEVDEDAGKIVGLTDIGRATVDRLKMNDTQQCAARQTWVYYFDFPRGPA